jgi:hypothetical protein
MTKFTRRHEQELAEIRALAERLGQSVEVARKQVKHIERTERRRQARSTPGAQRAEPLIAFVHIPKTAGGTVTSMFVHAFSKAAVRRVGNFLRNPEKTAAKVSQPLRAETRVAFGRVPYALYREHFPADTRYMTFLREPVDRVVSHYYRHLHGKLRSVDGERIAFGSIGEALEMGLPHHNNVATRLLCSDPAPNGDLPPSALDDAKANLREFAFVGIQERFDESIALLLRMFDLGLVPYEDRRVNPDRPAVEEISDEERTLIAERNRLDAELYEAARELFEEAVAAADEGLEAEADAVRRLSAASNDAAVRSACEWLDGELPVGTTRRRAALQAGAREVGISRAALQRARRLLAIEAHRDGDLQVIWSRTQDAGVTSSAG